jgi:hypothetical protein
MTMEIKHTPGVGTIIRNPDREIIMLLTWRSALRLEQNGMKRSRGKQVSTLARIRYGLPRNTPIPQIKERIEAELVERGWTD